MSFELLRERLTLLHKGKVRVTFDVPVPPGLESRFPHGLRLQVATDRLSTDNVVHISEVDGKGIMLTALTVYWFREVFHDWSHHLVAAGQDIYWYLPDDFYEKTGGLLHHRAVIVETLPMIPYELIWRNYFFGESGFRKDYEAGLDPHGLELPPGLPIMHKFDPPIFTPTDKSDNDDPVRSNLVRRQYPIETADALRMTVRATEHLKERGVAMVDTKLEMGRGSVMGDEVFTFDSSRFALLGDIKEGEDPPSMDKQIARQVARDMWAGGPKRSLELPRSTLDATAAAMRKALFMITGHEVDEWTSNELFDYHWS